MEILSQTVLQRTRTIYYVQRDAIGGSFISAIFAIRENEKYTQSKCKKEKKNERLNVTSLEGMLYPLYKKGMAQRARSRRILKTAFADNVLSEGQRECSLALSEIRNAMVLRGAFLETGGQTSWVPVVTDTPRVASVTNGLDKGATTPVQRESLTRTYEQHGSASNFMEEVHITEASSVYYVEKYSSTIETNYPKHKLNPKITEDKQIARCRIVPWRTEISKQ
ncbi:hypothetical protein G5I_11728 [Acromyrmex echinatior]|uniref:Uncharacterized protein n=1 Tax=Acromyrmex echinatior TaxID=103372 RepID=F4X0D6_ACREC|nr:hypothetical protein G5I_11728 [Acromyrmex echinatior]